MLLVFSPDLWWSRFFFLCPTFGSADLLSPIEMASRNETLESCTPYEKSVYKKTEFIAVWVANYYYYTVASLTSQVLK